MRGKKRKKEEGRSKELEGVERKRLDGRDLRPQDQKKG